jgi:hypothetical protein
MCLLSKRNVVTVATTMGAVAGRVEEARFVKMNSKQSKQVWEGSDADVRGSDAVKKKRKWRGKQEELGVENA